MRVILQTSSASAAGAAVRAAGAFVESSYASLVQALVPPARLEALAASNAVERVERPATFHPAAVPGEGVAAIGADDSQLAGFDGVGVKIAIFDGGFAGYTTRAGSRRPRRPSVS